MASHTATLPAGEASPSQPVEVFAVEDRSVQLTWAGAADARDDHRGGRTGRLSGRPRPTGIGSRARLASPVRSRAGRRPGTPARPDEVTAASRSTAYDVGRAAVRAGLEPRRTSYDVLLSGPAGPASGGYRHHPAPPPGPAPGRFATISDCHIGERWSARSGRLHDPRPRPPDLAAYPGALCPGGHRRGRSVGRRAAGRQGRSDPRRRGRRDLPGRGRVLGGARCRSR